MVVHILCTFYVFRFVTLPFPQFGCYYPQLSPHLRALANRKKLLFMRILGAVLVDVTLNSMISHIYPYFSILGCVVLFLCEGLRLYGIIFVYIYE